MEKKTSMPVYEITGRGVVFTGASCCVLVIVNRCIPFVWATRTSGVSVWRGCRPVGHHYDNTRSLKQF